MTRTLLYAIAAGVLVAICCFMALILNAIGEFR